MLDVALDLIGAVHTMAKEWEACSMPDQMLVSVADFIWFCCLSPGCVLSLLASTTMKQSGRIYMFQALA